MKTGVVKKTFSLRPGLWSWLSQFGNKSEIINKALEEYLFKHVSLQEYSVDTLWSNMEEYKKRVGYVSSEEQAEIETLIDGLSNNDQEIGQSDTFNL